MNLIITSKLLETFDIKCDTASSGEEAIKKIMSNEYDLVFMDHLMPHMDGVETTRVIRERGYKAEKLPIIALTSTTLNEVLEVFENARLNDYIPKPIDRKVFLNILKRWLPAGKIQNRQYNSAEIYSEIISQVAKIDEIDIDLAMKNANYKCVILESSLRILMHGLPEFVDKMHDYLAYGDIKNFTTEVHTLRVSLENVGAVNLAKLMQRIEIQSKINNAAFCRQNLPELNSQLLVLYKKLFAIIDNQGETSSRDKGDVKALKAWLEEIKKYINAFKSDDAVAIIKSVMTYTFGEQTDAFLQELLRLTEKSEYEKAVELINNENFAV